MAGNSWSDFIGTVRSFFRIGTQGPLLKDDSGHLHVRNAADNADADVKANLLKLAGDSLQINYDAASSGNDYPYTLQRPTSTMANAVTLTLPSNVGTNGQLLKTDGSGVLSWADSSGSTNAIKIDVTPFAFNSSSVVSMFTLPANATVEHIEVIVDTAFDETPSMSIGVNGGSASKYVPSNYVDLLWADKTIYKIYPGEQPNASAEALEIYYTAGAATVGAARVLVYYGEAA